MTRAAANWQMTALLASVSLIAAGAGPGAVGASPGPPQEDLPNILWLSSEDNGPHLGAYGDDFADTPSLDALAARGMIYRVAWSNAPVCGPARATIITGMYPPSLGSHHMRSRVPLPDGVRPFPAYLRDAGYYTTNNAKTDYNLAPAREIADEAWNESTNRAHWRNRPEGAPFFAVFNFNNSHESGIRSRPHEPIHDPAAVRVPPYHPDTPEVRRDWAQYYDKMTEIDARAGERLAELEADGLADSTIVVYFGDHGIGLPRGKRITKDSGLRVPMIVYVPEPFRGLAPNGWDPGGANDRLVAFVDLAPTMLSVAGIAPPDYMQGNAFLGGYATDPPEYLFGFRGRMDERDDLVRAVRDQRYVYVRNYLPHLPDGQHLWYMFETPTTVAWKRLYDAGGLPPEQAAYWEPRPAEELYDLETDPDEIVNLAGSNEHRDVLQRLRAAQRRHALEIHDIGFLPEAEMYERAGLTATGQPTVSGRGPGAGDVEAGQSPGPGGEAPESLTPYELGHDEDRYDLVRILRIAEQATDPELFAAGELQPALRDPDSAVRYWAAVGMLIRGEAAVRLTHDDLFIMLDDDSPSVRIVAAEALGLYGSDADLQAALDILMQSADISRRPLYEAVAALNALDYLDERAAGAYDRLAALPREDAAAPAPFANYVPRLLEKILADLGEGR